MGSDVKTVALELQPCCGKRSGIGVYTYELAKRLQDDERLHFCGNMFNFCGRNDNSEMLRDIRMPINESRMFPYGVYRRIWNYLPLDYARLFPAKADLSIFFNYIVPPRITGKVMTAVYDMTFLRFPETMDARNRRRLNEGLRRSVESSDRILTISEFSRREITELLGFPTERIAVIPCAPAFSEATASAENVFSKFGIQQPYLLYVGTLEPRKNLIRLLEAFARLKEREGFPHQLVLAGGKGWNSEAFDQALAASPVRESVRLTGYVSDEEKNTLYREAALFVFPSLYEGFGIPPLEAMHWNCPVVCTNAASLPEVCADAAEYVNPFDVNSIAEGISRVLTDETRRAELVRAGTTQVKQFTWEASADRLRDLCRKVLEES